MIPMELKQVFDRADDPVLPEEAPDVFEKFLADAQLAGELGRRPGDGFIRLESLRAETSQLDADLARHYRKLASEAEKKTPQPPASNELKKRFAGSEKTLFRAFFAEQRSLGKTVAQILDRFTDQARVEFAGVLRELAEEFA